MSMYQTSQWKRLRREALDRDGECVLGRLLGGGCNGTLQAHHVDPVEEGGAVWPDLNGLVILCARHHRYLHRLRREKDDGPVWRKCVRHRHPYPQGREECERRMNRGLTARRDS